MEVRRGSADHDLIGSLTAEPATPLARCRPNDDDVQSDASSPGIASMV
jgi:hypothetical protein